MVARDVGHGQVPQARVAPEEGRVLRRSGHEPRGTGRAQEGDVPRVRLRFVTRDRLHRTGEGGVRRRGPPLVARRAGEGAVQLRPAFGRVPPPEGAEPLGDRRQGAVVREPRHRALGKHRRGAGPRGLQGPAERRFVGGPAERGRVGARRAGEGVVQDQRVVRGVRDAVAGDEGQPPDRHPRLGQGPRGLQRDGAAQAVADDLDVVVSGVPHLARVPGGQLLDEVRRGGVGVVPAVRQGEPRQRQVVRPEQGDQLLVGRQGSRPVVHEQPHPSAARTAERHQGGPPGLRHLRRRHRLGGGGGQPLGETGHRGPVEQGAQQHVEGDPGGLGDPFAHLPDELGRQQGVATGVEELLVTAGLFAAQDVRPQRGDPLLGTRPRRVGAYGPRRAGHRRRPEQPLAVHLPVGGERQGVHDPDPCRDHVRGQPPGHPSGQLRAVGRCGAPVRYHEGDQAPLERVVARSQHHTGVHAGVFTEHRLDLAEFDPVSAYLDLLVRAPGELDLAVRQVAAEVAGAVQRLVRLRVPEEALRRPPGVAEIAGRQAGARDVQLADDQVGPVAQGGVEHVEALVRQGCSVRDAAPVRLDGPDPVVDRPDRRLRRPSQTDQLGTGDVACGVRRQRQRDPVAGEQRQPQRRECGGLDVQVVHQHVELRGDRVPQRHAVSGHRRGPVRGSPRRAGSGSTRAAPTAGGPNRS